MDWFEIVAPEASGEAIFSGFKLKWFSAFRVEQNDHDGQAFDPLQITPKLPKERGEGQRVLTMMVNSDIFTCVPLHRLKEDIPRRVYHTPQGGASHHHVIYPSKRLARPARPNSKFFFLS